MAKIPMMTAEDAERFDEDADAHERPTIAAILETLGEQWKERKEDDISTFLAGLHFNSHKTAVQKIAKHGPLIDPRLGGAWLRALASLLLGSPMRTLPLGASITACARGRVLRPPSERMACAQLSPCLCSLHRNVRALCSCSWLCPCTLSAPCLPSAPRTHTTIAQRDLGIINGTGFRVLAPPTRYGACFRCSALAP